MMKQLVPPDSSVESDEHSGYGMKKRRRWLSMNKYQITYIIGSDRGKAEEGEVIIKAKDLYSASEKFYAYLDKKLIDRKTLKKIFFDVVKER